MKYVGAILLLVLAALIQVYRILPERWHKDLTQKYPRLDVVCFWISVVLIASGLATACYTYLENDRLQVFASPGRISVIRGTNKAFTLGIANNLDHGIYEACLEISVEGGDMGLDGITITPLDRSSDPSQTPRYWFLVYRLRSGKSVKHLFADYMAPHSTKEFLVNANCANCAEASVVVFKMVSWAKSPSKFEFRHDKDKLPNRFNDIFKGDGSVRKEQRALSM